MRVLITGAGGFVGGHLIPVLMSAGHDVIASSQTQIQCPQGVRKETFDIRQKAKVREALGRNRPDAVIHLAGLASPSASWKDPQLTYRVNLLGASNVLEALREFPETRILLVGTAEQYAVNDGAPLKEGDPLAPRSPYSLSKLAQEMLGGMYHQRFGLRVIMTRSFNHSGPGQSAQYVIGAFCSKTAEIEAGIRDPKIEVGNLDPVRDFLDVRDVVEAYRLLLEVGRAGEVYNVCSGEGQSIRAILGSLLEMGGLTDRVEVIENTIPRSEDPPVIIGDNKKLKEHVGWLPKIPMSQCLRDTLEWWRRQTKGKRDA